MGPMRRVFILSMPVLLALLGAFVPSATSAASLPVVQARSADSLVESYGVGVHMNWLDTPYAQTTTMLNALSDLGVRHIRDDFDMNAPRQWDVFRQAAQRGIHVNLITGNPTDSHSAKEYVDTIGAQVPGAVESLEGTNEWDISGRSNWTSELRSRQAALYQAAKANPATRDLPVLAPSMAFVNNLTSLGDISSMVDESNGHFYAGGRVPTAPLDGGISTLNTYEGGHDPVVITEAGYNNALNTTNGHLPAPEDVVGAYMPRLLLESFSRGVRRVYSYELLDHFADSSMTDVESHFGLLRHDLSRKPSFTAMKTLLDLTSDPGASFTPGSLAYQVQGATTAVKQLLLQKSNGQFVLVLWRDANMWDPATRTRVAVSPMNLDVQLGTSAHIAAYQPTKGATPVAAADDTHLPVQLGGEAMVLTIDPSASPQPAPSPTPTDSPSSGTPSSTPSTGTPAGDSPSDAPTTQPPAAPTDLRATPGDKSVDLAWSSVTSPQSFQITRAPGGVTTQVAGDTRTLHVGGLRNQTTYTFTITPVTDGLSPAPVAFPAATPVAPPKIRTPRVHAMKGARVRVSWRRARGRAVSTYRVMTSTGTVEVPATQRRTVVQVPPRTRLRVGLAAKNPAGWSHARWSRRVHTR